MNTLILLKYLSKKLDKEFNLPSEIGFSSYFHYSFTDFTVTLTVNGHNDKFQEYFNMVIKYIKEFKYEEEDRITLKQ